MSTTSSNNLLSLIGRDLLKAVDAIDPVRCQELLEAAHGQTMTIALLTTSNIGVALGKAVKGFKRHQRTEGDETACWKPLVERGTQLIQKWKAEAAMEEKSTTKQAPTKSNHRIGLPTTVS